jgi:ureidoglycolate lyase
MNAGAVTLMSPDPKAFAPFGRLVTPPDAPGSRAYYSDALHERNDTSAPVLHVNHVLPQILPLSVDQIERHPFAAQCFFPLDVARYVVMVMPSDDTGGPCPDQALGFLMPANMGVIYHPRVWHLGATVLDRPGHFAVLMWRGGPTQDDDFQTIPPITLLEAT